MTFGALGLLVLGMYAMTALITDKPRRKKVTTEETPEEALVTRVADVVLHLAAAASQPGTKVEADRPRDEDRERAAVAAVALALALEGDAPQRDVTPADRYRAAAAAVAMAVACADAVPASVNVSTMPDAWNYHVRAQQLAGRGRR